jgi:hypothetical protein
MHAEPDSTLQYGSYVLSFQKSIKRAYSTAKKFSSRAAASTRLPCSTPLPFGWSRQILGPTLHVAMTASV